MSTDSPLYSIDLGNTSLVSREDSLTKRGSVIEIQEIYKTKLYKPVLLKHGCCNIM